MPLACPKTHYDLTLEKEPHWIAKVRSIASGKEERPTAYLPDDVDQDDFIDYLKTEVTEEYKSHLRRHKHSTLGVTFEHAAQANLEYVQGMFKSRNNELYPLLNYEIFGKKTFFFSGNLTEKLSETEINVSSELMALPFPSCMFVYDDDFAREAFFSTLGKDAPPGGPITVYLNRFNTQSGTAVISAHMYYEGASSSSALIRQLALVEGTDIEDVLNTDWTKVDGGAGYNDGIGVAGDNLFREEGLRMMRIVANSVLYLASANPDIIPGLREAPLINGRSPNKYEQKAYNKKLTAAHFIAVGTHAEPYSIPTDDEGRKLDHRVKVRGHWKNQAHGPEMSLRRRILIEPYWKGPDAAEVLNRPYSVGSKP